MNFYPSMIKPGMTGTYEGKPFMVLRHAEDGESFEGEPLINYTRSKVWVDYDGKRQLFAFPLIMSPDEWRQNFDQMPL